MKGEISGLSSARARDDAHLRSLLKPVSRSFYLTIRWLPGPVRAPIGLAYLLARASDTIADTEIVPLAARLDTLDWFRGRIAGGLRPELPGNWLNISAAASAGERALLEQIETVLGWLQATPAADRRLIERVLEIIISGQRLDLERFTGATAQNVIALNIPAELDDYTYRVAGCVGEFWTQVCQLHLSPGAPGGGAANRDAPGDLLGDAVRFGKGLQLTNILRDLPEDLRRGRCYLPRESLQARGLDPARLFEQAASQGFMDVYGSYLDEAEGHLGAGWRYIQALPRQWRRVRICCAWPLLIGLRTLGRLRETNVLLARQRIKISRAECRRILVQSVLYYPWPSRWQRLFPINPRRPNGVAS